MKLNNISSIITRDDSYLERSLGIVTCILYEDGKLENFLHIIQHRKVKEM